MNYLLIFYDQFNESRVYKISRIFKNISEIIFFDKNKK